MSTVSWRSAVPGDLIIVTDHGVNDHGHVDIPYFRFFYHVACEHDDFARTVAISPRFVRTGAVEVDYIRPADHPCDELCFGVDDLA